MEQYLAAHAGPLMVVFVASFLQSITGFGLVMIMAPLLMMFYDPKFAVILVILIASFGNLSQAVVLRKETAFHMILWLFVGSLAGQPLGHLFYRSFPSEA
ncbi:MAG: sulfite exporter TauE/SafE family protein, partial [Schwartzia sp.]|nr:sulfite exporter TauE/SafE family protein [Schwartzia sp. (in: firmicutes)]